MCVGGPGIVGCVGGGRRVCIGRGSRVRYSACRRVCIGEVVMCV